MPGEPKVLKLRDDALGALRREALSLSLFALCVAAAAVLAWSSRAMAREQLVSSGVVILLAGIVAIAIDLRRKRVAWGAFNVVLGDDFVEVRRVNGTTHRIEKHVVKHVVQTTWPAEGVVLRAPKQRPIFIPAAVEQFEALLVTVGGWAPLEVSRIPPVLARGWPVFILVVCALEALALGSMAGAASAAACVVLAAILGWSLWNVLRSHRLSARAKVLSLALLLPIAFLIDRAATIWRG